MKARAEKIGDEKRKIENVFQPVTAVRKTEWARQQILDAIRKGIFAVGERLPGERELAALLGIGRSSVREALSMLQIAGIVEVRHGSGVFVRRVPGLDQPDASLDFLIAEQDFLTITQARYFIEKGIVSIALEEPDPCGLTAMSTALSEMEEAVATRDINRFLEANVRFHQGLAEAGRNPVLAAFSHKLLHHLAQPKIKSVRLFFYQAEAGRLEQAIATHRDLYVALSNGDREAAFKAVYRHYADVVAPLIGGEPMWR